MNENCMAKIEEVKENELSAAFPLFSQLNPTMKKETFRNNYERTKRLEYKLFKATVCESNGERVVRLIGYLFNEDLCIGRAMYVDVLVVDKNYRKKGVGKRLMDFAVSRLH
ncbi:MAG: GNAT family N-acetyltransferase, partial [Holosporaceae bacterium]|nr:GNAT family N-acetyltransferase [Holosporaceae bacterium]